MEHPAEFQLRELGFGGFQIGLHGQDGVVVVFGAAHFEQLGAVADHGADLVDHQHHVFQLFALAAQFLGALGVIPDIRVFGQAGYFFQTVFLPS